MLGLFIPSSLASLRLYFAVSCLALVHLAIDRGRVSLKDGLVTSISDQSLHLITVLMTAVWLFPGAAPVSDLAAALTATQESRNSVLLLLVVYVGVIFAGGYLIRFLIKPLMADGLKSSDEAGELRNAGLYIGWLERFLFLTAILLKSPATVGLILTAKSIARYPEFKSERFAEYFLIGTLLSISIAILGGLVLLKVWYGAVILPE